jgi:hypothetical protein
VLERSSVLLHAPARPASEKYEEFKAYAKLTKPDGGK